MARHPRASDQPRRGSSLIDALFGRLGLDGPAREYRALRAWHVMAGRLGRHTRAERLRGSTLFVRAATAPWASELSYLRQGLLEKLRATPGGERIEELRFTIGPLDALPRWDEAEPQRTDPLAAPPAAPAAAPPAAGRPVVDGGPVAGALLAVQDPELRAALAELFAHASSTR